MLADLEYQGVYEKNILLAQLNERIQNGFGRMFVIRGAEDKIAAAYTVNAEMEEEKLAILGGLIVHPEYRKQGLAAEILSHVWTLLHQEGLRTICFIDSENIPSLRLHEKLGVDFQSVLCKFLKK